MDDSYEHTDQCSSLFYSPSNVPGPGADMDLFGERYEGCLESCSCKDQGGIFGCCCIARSYGPNYDPSLLFMKLEADFPVQECSNSCGCEPSVCPNRVVQRGPAAGLEVLAIRAKGKGLFTSVAMKKGTFVCEYAGEILGAAEARKRLKYQKEHNKSNYILRVQEQPRNKDSRSEVTLVDPAYIGNIGRYANHSCEPNLTLYPVRYDSLVPHVALFANRDIRPGEELTFNYGTNPEAVAAKKSRESLTACHCGSKKCQGVLPFQPEVDET